ncbi:MAG: restriction endonuclease [Candidatus Heimdallarchaeota archaeon]|nr:restriction endonuclease [Candidatus Heimdallarchaeota archaeon]
MKLDEASNLILSHLFRTKEIKLEQLTVLVKEKCEMILSSLDIDLASFFNNSEFSDKTKGMIILRLIEYGSNLGAISEFLDWKGFEIIISAIFDKMDYTVQTNFRFKDEFTKYEIDVLAFKFPYLFVIDCKHYKNPTSSSMKTAAIKQKERTEVLLEMFPILYEELVSKLLLPIKRKILLYPIIISWRDHDIQFHQNTPIVAFSQLSGFLQEMDEFRFNLFHLSLELD